MNGQRPPRVDLDTPVPCCGARILVFASKSVSGTPKQCYICPCGRRYDREARAQLEKNAFLSGEIAPPPQQEDFPRG